MIYLHYTFLLINGKQLKIKETSLIIKYHLQYVDYSKHYCEVTNYY